MAKSGGLSGVIDVASLTATQGFVIQGDRLLDQLGFSASIAGDIDGDGLADIVIGANQGSDGGNRAGEAYVIYGQAGTDGTQFGKAVSGRRVIDTDEPDIRARLSHSGHFGTRLSGLVGFWGWR